MPNSESHASERVKSALFLLALVLIVGYFALQAIPSAQRPTVHQQTTVPAPTSTHHVNKP